MKKTGAIFFALLSAAQFSYAQKGDTIFLKPGHINTSLIKPGRGQWLNFIRTHEDSSRKNAIFWECMVSFIDFEGRAAIGVKQLVEKDNVLLSSYAVSDRKTFAPLYHESSWAGRAQQPLQVNFLKRTVSLGGNLLSPTDTARMVRRMYEGLDSALYGNAFSWHTDLVFYATLPYKENRTFMIPFYEPGSSAMRTVAHTVTGSELLEGMDGAKVDCWLLETPTQKFWISKKTGDMMKLKERARYKIKLAYTDK